MKLDSFKHLYLEELRALYDAEQQLCKSLPAAVEAAVLPELRAAFADLLEKTQLHLQRLETIFRDLDQAPSGATCHTISGLIAEAEEIVRSEYEADPGVLDAALIATMQKIAHAQIASYGCVRTFAGILGETRAQAALHQSLQDEAAADERLTQLALRSVNLEAVQATDQKGALTEAVVSALEAAAR